MPLRRQVDAALATAAGLAQRHGPRALAAAGLVTFALLATSLPVQPELNPDTASYLLLQPSRPPAYGLLLNLLDRLGGSLGGLPQLQAAALLGGATALAIATARRLGSLLAGAAVMAAILLPSSLRYLTGVAMADALFAAAIMAMLAAALTLRPGRPLRGMVAVGAWAAAAIALRNAGLPLAIAAALYALALARTTRHPALPLVAAALLPTALALGASMAVHLAVNGRATPGSWSGVSLAGKGMMITRPGDEAWLPPPLRPAPALAAAAHALPGGMSPGLRMRARLAQYDAIRFHYLWPNLPATDDPAAVEALVGPAAWQAVRRHPLAYLRLAASDWLALWLLPGVITPAERAADEGFLRSRSLPLLDRQPLATAQMLLPAAERPAVVWLRRAGAALAFVAGIAAVLVALGRTWRRRPLGLAGAVAFAALALNGSFVAIAAAEGGLGRYAAPLWPAQVLLCAVSLAWVARAVRGRIRGGAPA